MKISKILVAIFLGGLIGCKSGDEITTPKEGSTTANNERTSEQLPLHQRLLKSPLFEKVARDMIQLEEYARLQMEKDRAVVAQMTQEERKAYFAEKKANAQKASEILSAQILPAAKAWSEKETQNGRTVSHEEYIRYVDSLKQVTGYAALKKDALPMPELGFENALLLQREFPELRDKSSAAEFAKAVSLFKLKYAEKN